MTPIGHVTTKLVLTNKKIVDQSGVNFLKSSGFKGSVQFSFLEKTHLYLLRILIMSESIFALISFKSTKRLRTLKKEIMDYIEVETASIGDDQILLGSSDIIESVFGRYKGFSGKTPMKEVGRAVLGIPVFTGKFEAAEVKTAMESVSAKDVDDWLRQNIGESFFSKRKRVFSFKKPNLENSSVKLFPEILKKVASF